MCVFAVSITAASWLFPKRHPVPYKIVIKGILEANHENQGFLTMSSHLPALCQVLEMEPG